MPFFGSEYFGGGYFGGLELLESESTAISQNRYIALAQIELDAGNEFVASHRVTHPSHIYYGRIVNIGTITRAIPYPSGTPITADCVIEIADTDRYWHQILYSRAVRRKTVTIKLVKEGASESAEIPVFVGEIVEFTSTERSVRLTLTDHSFAWLDEYIPSLGTRELWPYMAQGQDEFFFPIIQGNCISLDSNLQGAIPLPHIGPIYLEVFLHTYDRFALARHPVVGNALVIYRQLPGEGAFTLVDSSEYVYRLEPITIDAAVYDVTFVDFFAIQPDGTEIRADVYGFYSRPPFGALPAILPASPVSTDTLRNPIDFFINVIQPIFTKLGAAADAAFDTVHVATLRDKFETYGFKADGALTESMTVRAFLGQFLSSFQLDFFVDKEGIYDLAFMDESDELRPLWTQHDVMIKDSWQENLADVANRIRYNYAKNSATGEFAERRIFDNIVDQIAEGGTYSLIEEESFDLHWVRDAFTAQEMTLRRMMAMSIGTFRQTFKLPLPISRVKDNLELAKLVGITHSYGLDNPIEIPVIGYYNREVKILGTQINLLDYSVIVNTVVRAPNIMYIDPGLLPATDIDADQVQVWYDVLGGGERVHVVLAGPVDSFHTDFDWPISDPNAEQVFVNDLLQVENVDYTKDAGFVHLTNPPMGGNPSEPDDIVHGWYDDYSGIGPIRRYRESLIETADGIITTFHFPEAFIDSTEQIIVGALTLTRDRDYTVVDAMTGEVEFIIPPLSTEQIELFYSVTGSSNARTNTGHLIGTVDNVNRIFRMPERFVPNSERIYVNNLHMQRGVDYRIVFDYWIIFSYAPMSPRA